MIQLPLYMVSDLTQIPHAARQRLLCVALREDAHTQAGWAGVVVQPPPSPFRQKHSIGCACCSRDGLTVVLSGLFQDRILGRRDFDAVVLEVSEQDTNQVFALLKYDNVLAARYILDNKKLKENP